MSRREYPPIENLTAFKAAVESPAGCDPMPVEQHEFPMKHPKLISRAVTEFMSVIYSHTIRKGHRQPVAVFAGGKKLFTLRDVAEDRGWSEDWTQRVFRQACACGLVRAGRGKDDYPPAAIVLNGRVKPLEIQEDTETNELVGPEGTLRSRLSSAEFQQYERLPKDVKDRFLEEELREFKLDDRIEADAIRLARHYNAERHVERLTRYGITPDPEPAKRYLDKPVVELKLVPEELAAAATGGGVDARSVRSEGPAAGADTYTGADTPVYTPAESAASFSGFPEVSSQRNIRTSSAGASDDHVGALGSSSSSLRSDNGSASQPENVQAAQAISKPKPTRQHARQNEDSEDETRDIRDQVGAATKILANPESDPSDVKYARQTLDRYGVTTPAATFDPDGLLTKTLFHRELTRVFLDAGKPVPSKQQSDQAFSRLDSESRGHYIEDLQSRIASIYHPGVLAGDAKTFAESWPQRKIKLRAAAEQRKKFAEMKAQQERETQAAQNEDARKEAQRILEDPKASESERQVARIILGEDEPLRRTAGGK